MRHSTPKWLLPLLTLPLLAMPAAANAEPIRASLIGYQEVPAVNTVATGQFKATINPGDLSIDYELTYSGLQGTVQQAHIHVAQKASTAASSSGCARRRTERRRSAIPLTWRPRVLSQAP